MQTTTKMYDPLPYFLKPSLQTKTKMNNSLPFLAVVEWEEIFLYFIFRIDQCKEGLVRKWPFELFDLEIPNHRRVCCSCWRCSNRNIFSLGEYYLYVTHLRCDYSMQNLASGSQTIMVYVVAIYVDSTPWLEKMSLDQLLSCLLMTIYMYKLKFSLCTVINKQLETEYWYCSISREKRCLILLQCKQCMCIFANLTRSVCTL